VYIVQAIHTRASLSAYTSTGGVVPELGADLDIRILEDANQELRKWSIRGISLKVECELTTASLSLVHWTMVATAEVTLAVCRR
jgi:hypothetical protein